MKIENSEALKNWLVTYLGPICFGNLNLVDLAKYIVTLIKSKKPDNELRECCLNKLDIFLPGDAELFVDTLFKVVKDRSYLNKDDANHLAQDGGAKSARTWSQTNSEKKKKLQVNKESTQKDNQVPRNTLKSVIGNSAAIMERLGNGNSESNVRSGSEERMDENVLHKKVIKQEKHDWDSLEEKDTNPSKKIRNDTGGEKKPSHSRSKSGDSRSSRFKGSHNSTPQYSYDHEDSFGSKTNANSSGSQKKNGSEVDGQSDDYESESWSSQSRSLYNTVLQYSDDHGDSFGLQAKPSSSVVQKQDAKKSKSDIQNRCEDFEERGFCVLGDQCSFDHGTDPVVYSATPSNNYVCSTYPPAALQQGVVSSTQPLPPFVPTLYPPGTSPYAPEMFQDKQDYNDQETFWMSSKNHPSFSTCLSLQNRSVVINSEIVNVPAFDPTRPPPPIHTYPKVQRPRARELINVPTIDNVDSTSPAESEPLSSNSSKVQSSHKKQITTPHVRISVASAELGLVLKINEVPRHLNYVENLTSHFVKFGDVTNIVTHVDGDPQAAVIHFKKRAEAEAAYRYKGDILGNPSIKMSWYKKVAEKRVYPMPSTFSSSVDNSCQNVTSSEMKSIKLERVSLKTPTHKKIEFESSTTNRRNSYSLVLSASKQRKEQQEKTADLQKKKLNILQYQHYLKTQKLLMDQLGTCTKPSQINYIKEETKKYMVKSEQLRAEIMNEESITSNNVSVETKAEVSKSSQDSEIKVETQEEISLEQVKVKQEAYKYEDDEDSDVEDRCWRR